jgi:uncharacterized membrane protein (GlpM family)
LTPYVLLLRLIASFIAGFAVVALITALADIRGQGPAGFLGGIPSAGPVSLLFIGLTQSQAAAVQATSFFPLGFSSTFAFLLFYAVPKTLRFSLRMAIALGLWLPISAAIALWGPADYYVSLTASVVIVVVVLMVRRRIPTGKVGGGSTTPTVGLTLLRGTLGGLVVTSVVLLSEVSGPQVGGVFAAAPAIWTSSLYVTSRTRGIEFSRSLTLSFMQTAIFTLIPYGVAARYFFATSGIWWGTLFSFAAISPLALLAWWLVNRKSQSAPPPD